MYKGFGASPKCLSLSADSTTETILWSLAYDWTQQFQGTNQTGTKESLDHNTPILYIFSKL